MKRILIDGSFVSKRVTGVQRFNWEVLKELVTYDDVDWAIAVSEDTNTDGLKFDNLKIIKKGKKNNKFWQFFTLAKLAKKEKRELLCMSNLSPLFKKDYLVLHDVTFLDKEGNNSFFWAIKYRIFVSFGINRFKKIFTVSEFSKNRILTHYKNVKESDVIVVYNGGDHLEKVGISKPKFEIPNKYYLTVGSTTKNKNFQYICNLAQKNPNEDFKIVGRIDFKLNEKIKNIKNIKFTGYVSSEELHYLYKNAEAFILPSTYEGFGIPPLEALYCGCERIALSNIPVFKELYGDVANFFNPLEYNNLLDLKKILRVDDAARIKILNKYKWKNVAKKIYEEIKEA